MLQPVGLIVLRSLLVSLWRRWYIGRPVWLAIQLLWEGRGNGLAPLLLNEGMLCRMLQLVIVLLWRRIMLHMVRSSWHTLRRCEIVYGRSAHIRISVGIGCLADLLEMGGPRTQVVAPSSNSMA